MPITLSQLYEISKIYVCLRRFLKKLNVFWFLSPFNQTTKIVILAHFPPYCIQKGAVEGLGTNYLVTSTRYLRLANISKVAFHLEKKSENFGVNFREFLNGKKLFHFVTNSRMHCSPVTTVLDLE